MSETTDKRRGVLFDLDGVLLDSEGQYSIFWGGIDKEYPTGIPNFENYIKGFHLTRIINNFFEGEDVRRQIMERLLEFERNMRFEFFPGALDFVKNLHAAGIPMAIVTSSDLKKMEALYAQCPDFPTLFDQIITGDMVTKAKPDPDCFLLGAKLLDVDIKDCIVFEDSRNGLIAARKSGATVIGVTTTLPAQEVREMSDLTVSAVSELSIEDMLSCRG